MRETVPAVHVASHHIGTQDEFLVVKELAKEITQHPIALIIIQTRVAK